MKILIEKISPKERIIVKNGTYKHQRRRGFFWVTINSCPPSILHTSIMKNGIGYVRDFFEYLEEKEKNYRNQKQYLSQHLKLLKNKED